MDMTRGERTRFITALIGSVNFLILLILFTLNLFRGFKNGETEREQVVSNIASVNDFNWSDVVTVEERIRALEEPTMAENTDTRIYAQIFENSVVIGDSLTEGLSSYGFLTTDEVYSQIGASVIRGEELFQTAAANYPKCAFFAFGMNDMGNYNGNAERFTEKYAELLRAFHETSPDSELYVCSITEPTEATISANASLAPWAEFNDALEDMCRKLDYVTYVDITYILEENPNLYAGDGLHAQKDYYPLWIQKMIDVAGLT